MIALAIHCFILLENRKIQLLFGRNLQTSFRKILGLINLELRCKLYSLCLREGGSVQGHIKALTEIFDALAVVGDPVSEEDRVVHLLASLLDSFDMLVTALEANKQVPKMESVTEHLLHEEHKLKDKKGDHNKVIISQSKFVHKKGESPSFNCHYCGKPAI